MDVTGRASGDDNPIRRQCVGSPRIAELQILDANCSFNLQFEIFNLKFPDRNDDPKGRLDSCIGIPIFQLIIVIAND